MGERLVDSDFLKRLERLSLNIERLMNAGGGGFRKSRAKGSSVEFSDFREYTLGDDLRRIDWSAYGRLDKFFVKLFMEEREAFINVFIDGSKSMNFGIPKKSILALQLSAAFSYLSLINMDRLCLNVLEDKNIRESEVFGGRGQFDRCVSFLEGVEFKGITALDEAIKKKKFIGRGLSVIISDFFTGGDLEDLMKYLIYNKQEIVLINILSPEEQNPQLGGSVRLKDVETGEGIDVELTSSTLDKYEKALKAFIGNMQEMCKKYGALYVNILSEYSMEKVLFEELIGKRIVK